MTLKEWLFSINHNQRKQLYEAVHVGLNHAGFRNKEIEGIGSVRVHRFSDCGPDGRSYLHIPGWQVQHKNGLGDKSALILLYSGDEFEVHLFYGEKGENCNITKCEIS